MNGQAFEDKERFSSKRRLLSYGLLRSLDNRVCVVGVSTSLHRLVGLVVKASASGEEDPGLLSRTVSVYCDWVR